MFLQEEQHTECIYQAEVLDETNSQAMPEVVEENVYIDSIIQISTECMEIAASTENVSTESVGMAFSTESMAKTESIEFQKKLTHQIQEYSVLQDTIRVITEDISSLNKAETANLLSNTRYGNQVLFQEADSCRQNEVRVIYSHDIVSQYQGRSNYCGLCVINNAIGIPDNGPLVDITEMDKIADELWLDMVANPALGLTFLLEPMRDREGFYAFEVLQATLQKKGYSMLHINAATLGLLSFAEVGGTVFTQLMEEHGIVSFIIRLQQSQHWIAIRFIKKKLYLFDSKVTSLQQITLEILGKYVKENASHPGAVCFLMPPVSLPYMKTSSVFPFETSVSSTINICTDSIASTSDGKKNAAFNVEGIKNQPEENRNNNDDSKKHIENNEEFDEDDHHDKIRDNDNGENHNNKTEFICSSNEHCKKKNEEVNDDDDDIKHHENNEKGNGHDGKKCNDQIEEVYEDHHDGSNIETSQYLLQQQTENEMTELTYNLRKNPIKKKRMSSFIYTDTTQKIRKMDEEKEKGNISPKYFYKDICIDIDTDEEEEQIQEERDTVSLKDIIPQNTAKTEEPSVIQHLATLLIEKDFSEEACENILQALSGLDWNLNWSSIVTVFELIRRNIPKRPEKFVMIQKSTSLGHYGDGYIECIPVKFKRDFMYPADIDGSGTATLFHSVSLLFFGDESHIHFTRMLTICNEILDLVENYDSKAKEMVKAEMKKEFDTICEENEEDSLALFHLKYLPKALTVDMSIYNGSTSVQRYEHAMAKKHIDILKIQKYGNNCTSYLPIVEGIFLRDRKFQEREQCGTFAMCHGLSNTFKCEKCFQTFHIQCVLPKIPFQCGCHVKRPYLPKDATVYTDKDKFLSNFKNFDVKKICEEITSKRKTSRRLTVLSGNNSRKRREVKRTNVSQFSGISEDVFKKLKELISHHMPNCTHEQYIDVCLPELMVNFVMAMEGLNRFQGELFLQSDIFETVKIQD